MKIGIIREGKVPPDKRVPLSPSQCKDLIHTYPEVELVIQPSPIRCFDDAAYQSEGLTLQEDLSNCDVLMGVKEVNKEDLIPGKTYFFFSHTFKKQPYNRDLLQAVLDKKIRLIDYEVITNARGTRLIGFGRYAGVVGAYNGLLAWGRKMQSFDLMAANACFDRVEMEKELSKVSLPKNFKLVITGGGRVAGGAKEIVNAAGIKLVSPEEFLTKDFDVPVYTQLHVEHYNEPQGGHLFNRNEYYRDPRGYRSSFMKYAKVADMYVPCHYWDAKAPYLFTREDAKRTDFNIKVVADISCDIDCAVASTIRPSTIADPLYGYDPIKEAEVDFMKANAIGVMAVDNLPCELPKDASEDFGKELLAKVLPCLLKEDPENVMARASETTLNGELTEYFAYLKLYLEGKE
ncbi:MAG: saccharopine dehydrogenase (NAD+, L-lysine-forming) [Flavobacteriales bacterium]|jgi:saccharopine dehydrogenase (NAD+, L-lysine-forming)